MKNLLFICGPNGIGKTTICKEIVRMLPNSAYVDSDLCRLMNLFILNDETIPTIAKNISDLLINCMDCTVIETVIFSYGFHGRRREVFEIVMKAVSEYEEGSILIRFLKASRSRVKVLQDIIWRKGPRRSYLSFIC